MCEGGENTSNKVQYSRNILVDVTGRGEKFALVARRSHHAFVLGIPTGFEGQNICKCCWDNKSTRSPLFFASQGQPVCISFNFFKENIPPNSPNSTSNYCTQKDEDFALHTKKFPAFSIFSPTANLQLSLKPRWARLLNDKDEDDDLPASY